MDAPPAPACRASASTTAVIERHNPLSTKPIDAPRNDSRPAASGRSGGASASTGSRIVIFSVIGIRVACPGGGPGGRMDRATTRRSWRTGATAVVAVSTLFFLIASCSSNPATFTREGDELVVTPISAVLDDAHFSVDVSYDGVPDPLHDPDIGRVGWIDIGPTSYVVGEPHGAHAWFPGNDHPSDKAIFEFRVTVPTGVVAVANGTLSEQRVAGATTMWIWDQSEPMATYLATVAIGDFTIQTGVGPHGLPLRNVFATRLAAAAADATARTAEMIEVLESWFGPYPFSTYGALVVDDGFGFALETQTLSLFPRSIAVRTTASQRIQVHELAHQWFGDSLSMSRWQDIWLNEGFATYTESLWLERTQPGYDIDREMQSFANKKYGPITHPTSDTLFGNAEYERGAIVLHALRRTVGDEIFFAILRDYA